jgi:hypothetical protein
MMEAADRALFVSSVRHATKSGGGAALDVALHDLGWDDALDADRATAVSVLFECLGSAHATSGALDRLLADALGRRGPAVAVVLPALRECDPPGRRSGDHCHVRGLGTEAFGRSDEALVVASDAGHAAAFLVARSALQHQAVQGLDSALGLVAVTGQIDVDATTRTWPVDWNGAVALGQLALGAELVGAARAMLELARVHALERMQFGRPIASFQAVRHRLAEALVAIEAAAALLDAAWDDPSPVTAGMAKAFAGRSARSAARHCQQVLAGIGFTTEHPLHLFIRRMVVLDQLLGAGSLLTRQLGTNILDTSALPPTFPL